MASLKKITQEELEVKDGRDGTFWTAIDNNVYDITEFLNTHPGGQIIKLCAGRDGTTLFESYHTDASLERCRAALQNKTTLVGTLKDPAPVADKKFFQAVRKRVDEHLKSKNLERTTALISVTEMLVTLALYFYVTYLVATGGSYFWAAILGVLTGRLGFIMHSGNHASLSRSTGLNQFGAYVMDFIGSAHVIWRYEHDVAHHCDPNVHGKDNDCEIGDPFLRFHPELKRKWWHKYQHIVTIVAMSVGLFKWYFSDPVHFYIKKVGNIKFNTDSRDWAWLMFWKSVWFVLHVIWPWYNLGFSRMMALTTVFMVIGGHYLENIFIVNHIQDELVPDKNAHWAVKQVSGTADWAAGSPFWNWVSGGLNHQIEHHLFPTYSIYLYPTIAPIVEQTCKEFNLPYVKYPGFMSAWFSMLEYLKRLGTDEYDNWERRSR